MNQTSWYVLEETDAFGVIKVRNLWDETGDAFDGVFVHMLFEERLLDPVLETFVGRVDAKLIEGVGTAGHVLGPGIIEETDESGKIVFAEPSVDMFVQPGKEKGVKGLGQIVSIVRSPIWVEEDGAELLFQHLRLI